MNSKNAIDGVGQISLSCQLEMIGIESKIRDLHSTRDELQIALDTVYIFYRALESGLSDDLTDGKSVGSGVDSRLQNLPVSFGYEVNGGQANNETVDSLTPLCRAVDRELWGLFCVALGLSRSGTVTEVITEALAAAVLRHAESVFEQLDCDEGTFESLWYEHETDDFESAVDAAHVESEDAELQQQLRRASAQTVRTLKLPAQRTLNGKVRHWESRLAADLTVRIHRLRDALTILTGHSP